MLITIMGIMAEFQTITAAATVAQLAWGAAGLIRQVFTAESEARKLSCDIHHIARLAKITETLLFNRSSIVSGVQASSVEEEICCSIRCSLDECSESLRLLYKQLKPFEDRTNASLVARFSENLKFVRSNAFREEQGHIIESRMQSLSLSIQLLNSHDLHVDRHRFVGALLALNGSIRQDAQRRQTQLASQLPLDTPQLNTDQIPDRQLHRHNSCSSCRNLQPEDSMIVAVKKNNIQTVLALVAAGTDIRARDAQGRTALHLAASRLDLAVLQAILDSSPEMVADIIDAKDSKGHTALIIVATQANSPLSVELAKLLIEHRCDVNKRDKCERDALFWVFNGPPEQKQPSRVHLAWLLYKNDANVFSSSAKQSPNYRTYYKLLEQLEGLMEEQDSSPELGRTQTAPPGPAANKRRNTIDVIGGLALIPRRHSSAAADFSGTDIHGNAEHHRRNTVTGIADNIPNSMKDRLKEKWKAWRSAS